MQIGVLALQGAFIEHIKMLEKLGVQAREVRNVGELQGLQGLIIPGGESSAIKKLIDWNKLKKGILENVSNGMKVFGTCAGAVLLAREIVGENRETLNLMDVTVKRNAYGRQLNSFVKDVKVKGIGEVSGVFIRAPVFTETGKEVKVLAREGKNIVMLENKKCLAASFHPELTDDLRIHKYFLKKIRKRKKIN